MKLLQESERKLSSIVMPGGWDKGLDQANVDRLRATIMEVIKVHGRDEAPKHIPFPPIIIDQADRLHAGRHRIAAFKACSLSSIRTAKYEFSGPREAEMVELRENLHRRVLSDEDQAKATKRLVELLTEEEQERDQVDLRTEYKDQETASKPGPKKSAKARAVERAAEATGITEGGVRKRLEKVEQLAAAAKEPEVVLEMWGMDELPGMRELRADAGRIQAAMDSVSALVARAQAKLAEIDDTAAARRWPALHNLREDLHRVGRTARALRPAALCPFCKGVVANCPTCNERELVGEGEMERTPGELKLGEGILQPNVCVGPGQFVKLSEGKGMTYGKTRATAKNGKGKAKLEKQVQVVDENGDPIVVPPDPPAPASDEDGDIPF